MVGDLLKDPIAKPTSQELTDLKRFLVYRFKAHHLTLEESCYHLLNCEGKPEELEGLITVGELVEVLMAEPFSVLSNRYIEVSICELAYNT